MRKGSCIGTSTQFRSPLQRNSYRFQKQKRFERLRLAILSITCIVALLVCASSALAQTATTGALTGVVTDPSGAVISGATVTATNVATGQARSVNTDASGVYRISLLPPGNYGVKFAATGFKTVEVPSVAINVTETESLSHSLEVGSQTQQVTVESTTERIQTENATIGGLVSGETITSLPLASRNYTQIMNLSPGVVTNVASSTQFGNGTQDVNVNGSSTEHNNYMMDGATITNYGSGGGAQSGSYAGIGIPNPDSLQEFKVQTSQYDASYGQQPGAVVNVVTKSGTNQFHGAIWEFNRNNVFNANEFFLKHSERVNGLANTPPDMKQNQYGMTFGGPIKKDKLFFFTSYQGTRQLNGLGTQGFVSGISAPSLLPLNQPGVPIANARDDQGPGYTVPLNLTPGNSPCDASTYQKYLGCTFAGAKDVLAPAIGTGVVVAQDGSNISQTAINLFRQRDSASRAKGGFNQGYYVPSLTVPATGLPCRTTNTCATGTTISQAIEANEEQYMVNTDYVVSSKHTFSEKFFYSSEPQIQSFACFGQCDPGAPEKARYKAYSGTAKLTSVLTNNLVNEAFFSFQRLSTQVADEVPIDSCAGDGTTPLKIIPSVNNGAPCPVVAGAPKEATLVPVISSSGIPGSGFGAFVLGGNFASATTNLENFFQGGEQISWNHGKHSIRAGVGVNHIQWNWTLQTRSRGQFVFGNIADILTSSAGAADGTASPALNGVLAAISFRLSPAPDSINPHHMNKNDYSAFVEDDIKLTRKLTVNLGLRYEHDGFPTDVHGVLTNVFLSQAATVNTGSFFLGQQASNAACGNGTAFGAAGCVANQIGTLAGLVIQSNYNRALYGNLAAPNGATGIFTNNRNSVFPTPPIANFAPRIGVAWQPADRLVVRGGFGIFYDRLFGNLLGVNILSGFPPYSNTVATSRLETLSNPAIPQALGFVPRTLKVTAGDPVNGATTVTDITGGNGTRLAFTHDDQSLSTPLVYQYNLDVQYEFAHGWIADVGYVGTHGTHLFDWDRDPNLAYFIAGAPNPPADRVNQLLERPSSSFPFNDAANTNPATQVLTNTSSNFLARTAYLGVPPSGLQTVKTDGTHSYNSLQLALRRQFTHGLTVQASYTWSQLLTDVNAPQAGGNGGIAAAGTVLSGSSSSNDPLNSRQQRGPAAFNRPQRFVASYRYDFPYKSEGWRNKVLGGWAVAGVTTVQSGQFFSVIDGSGATLLSSTTAAAGYSVRSELADPVNCNSLGNCKSGTPFNTSGGLTSRLGGSFGGPGFINKAAFAPLPTFGGYPNPTAPNTGTCFAGGGLPAGFLNCGRGFGDSPVGILRCCTQHNWDMAIIKTTQITESKTLEFRTEFFNAFNHAQFNQPIDDSNSAQFGQILSSAVSPRIIQFGLKFIF